MIKKFLDRYLFSRLGLQLLFSVIAILLLSAGGTLLRNWATHHSAADVYSQAFWGFRQITDGGSMAWTLDALDEVAAESGNGIGAPVVLVIALASWLVGLVLYGFVADWKLAEKKKDAFLHCDLVPFDKLDPGTKELDRVPIAAMIALDYGKDR